MQATLVYLAAPVDMRSRILGVLSVCIGTGPIGFVWLGWLADLIGAPRGHGDHRRDGPAGARRDLAAVAEDLKCGRAAIVSAGSAC